MANDITVRIRLNDLVAELGLMMFIDGMIDENIESGNLPLLERNCRELLEFVEHVKKKRDKLRQEFMEIANES